MTENVCLNVASIAAALSEHLEKKGYRTQSRKAPSTDARYIKIWSPRSKELGVIRVLNVSSRERRESEILFHTADGRHKRPFLTAGMPEEIESLAEACASLVEIEDPDHIRREPTPEAVAMVEYVEKALQDAGYRTRTKFAPYGVSARIGVSESTSIAEVLEVEASAPHSGPSSGIGITVRHGSDTYELQSFGRAESDYRRLCAAMIHRIDSLTETPVNAFAVNGILTHQEPAEGAVLPPKVASVLAQSIARDMRSSLADLAEFSPIDRRVARDGILELVEAARHLERYLSPSVAEYLQGAVTHAMANIGPNEQD